MGNRRRVIAVAAGLALSVSGCGSGKSDDPGAGGSGGPKPSPTVSASAPSSPSSTATVAPATGTLATKPVKCASIKPPATVSRAGSGPEVMCAFESETDYVSFGVGTRQARTFEAAKTIEQARSNGKTVIEPVSVDGWTFGARWPANGSFVRVQQWLVDSTGQVLLCKMGSDRGEAGITELSGVCEQAKTALYTE